MGPVPSLTVFCAPLADGSLLFCLFQKTLLLGIQTGQGVSISSSQGACEAFGRPLGLRHHRLWTRCDPSPPLHCLGPHFLLVGPVLAECISH